MALDFGDDTGPILLPDPDIAGLYLRMGKTTRRFIYKQSDNGRMIATDLGDFPAMSLRDARARVTALRHAPMRAEQDRFAAISEDITVTEFFSGFFEPMVLMKIKSHKSQKRIFQNHIEPMFGPNRFRDIHRKMVYQWAAYLTQKGLQNATQNRIRVLFGQILGFAYELEVPEVPDRRKLGLKQLPTTTSYHVFLKPDEVDRIKSAIKHSRNADLSDIINLLLLSGARKREVLDMEWRYVDLKNRQWMIPVSKNGKPRYIHLGDAALGLLVKRHITNTGSRYVFPSPRTGQPYRCIFNSWKYARELAGFPELRIHDLRHSFASALVNSGATLYDVQHLLGHSSMRTTQRYAHLASDRLQNAARLIDDVYG